MSKSAAFKSSGFKPGYRPGVGVMVLKDVHQVWVGQRCERHTGKKDTYWQMPQGGLEKELEGGLDRGENPLKGAHRELKEETSIQSVDLIAQTQFCYHYDFPEPAPLVFKTGVFRGQSQRWIAFHFRGDEGEIDINTSHPEFCRWKWMDIKEISLSVVPFKRKVYEAVIEELTPLIQDFYQT